MGDGKGEKGRKRIDRFFGIEDKMVCLGRMEWDVQCATCIIIVIGSSRLLRNFLTIIPSSYILRVIIILSFSRGKANSARWLCTQMAMKHRRRGKKKTRWKAIKFMRTSNLTMENYTEPSKVNRMYNSWKRRASCSARVVKKVLDVVSRKRRREEKKGRRESRGKERNRPKIGL